MFIKFWDEDDNIVFLAMVALITMPIWGSIILLIRGAGQAYAWILAHQTIIYAVLFGIIGITAIVSSIFALRILKKNKITSVPIKLYFTLVPCLGTVGASINLYRFIDIAHNASTTETGLLLLFHFIIWLVVSLIAFFVVLVGQIFATCQAAACYSKWAFLPTTVHTTKHCRKSKQTGYLWALLPYGEIVTYWLLGVIL